MALGFFEAPFELAFRLFDPDEDPFFSEGDRFFSVEDRLLDAARFLEEEDVFFFVEEGVRFFPPEEEDVFFLAEEEGLFFVDEPPDDFPSPEDAVFFRRFGRSELVRRPFLASGSGFSPDRRVVRVRPFVPFPSLVDAEPADRLAGRFFLLGLRFWVRASPDRAMIVSSVPR